MGENNDTRLAVIEERLRSMDSALRLQALEYDRRLGELNHAHEKSVEDRTTFVDVEIHDRDMTAMRDAVTALVDAADKKAEGLALALTEAKSTSDERFARVEAFQAKMLGAFALVVFLVPFAMYLLR